MSDNNNLNGESNIGNTNAGGTNTGNADTQNGTGSQNQQQDYGWNDYNGHTNRKSRYTRGDEYCRSEGSGLVPGLILIAIGVLWLLDKFSYVNFSLSNLIGSFIDLWPLVLVVVGVNMIFKRYRIVRSISWIVFLGILLSYSIFGPSLFGDQFKMFGDDTFRFEVPDQRNNDSSSSTSQFGIESQNYPMSDYTPLVKNGDFELNLGAGDIQIGSENENLVSYVIPSNILDQKDVMVNGENAKLRFSQKGNVSGKMKGSINYDFYLNKDVLWHLSVNTGAIDGKFDLENVMVRNLEVNSGASDLKLRLGNLQESAKISINSAASDINLEVPKDSGIRITINGIGDKDSLIEEGLVKKDNTYESPGYDTAEHKIDMEINTPLTDLKLDRY